MVELSLTSSVGDADLFASFTAHAPSFENHTYRSANAGGDVLRIPPSDAAFCAALPCTLYVGVLGWGQDTTFTLLARQDIAAPSRLYDGVPQRVVEAAAETWRYFEFSPREDVAGFTVAVTPSVGDPDLYVSSDGALPSRTHFGWHADAVGEDALTVDAHDAGWCAAASCTYLVGVHAAQGAAAYAITAAVASSIEILEEGVRHEAAIGPAEARHYRLYVPGGGVLGGRTGVRVTLTALSGTVVMYMADSSVARPNATEHVWSSASSAGAASASTSSIVVPHDDATVAACLRRSSQCVLHLALASPRGAAFTVLANLEVADMGLALLAPEGPLKRSYVMARPAALEPRPQPQPQPQP